MLSINNVSYCVGNKKILRDVTMTIKKGEIYGFLGPNGAGKTTTLRIICGLLTPKSGEVIKDRNISIKGNVGVLFHKDGLYQDMTAKQNLIIFNEIFNDIKNNNRVDNLLNDVGLYSVRDEKVVTFSKGMKKRLCIARAFITNPSMVIMDEPFSDLDIEGKEWLCKYIAKINADYDTTFLISSHDIYEVSKICNKIGIIDKGKIQIEKKVNPPIDTFELEKLYKNRTEK